MDGSFHGVVTPVVSIFDSSRAPLVAAQSIVARHAVENGASVVFALGSTGEGQFLQANHPSIRHEIVSACQEGIEPSGINVPVIAGVYGNDAVETIVALDSLMAHSPKKVDGIVISPPLDVKLDDGGLMSHFSMLLERLEGLEMPTFLYNNPAAFGKNNIPLEMIRRLLSRHQHIAGIKDSSPSLPYKEEIIALVAEHGDCCFYTGREGDFYACLEMGSGAIDPSRIGCIPSIGNVLSLPAKIHERFLAGDTREAEKLQDLLNGVRNKIYHEPKRPGKAQRGCKLALAYMYPGKGFPDPPVVSPDHETTITHEARSSMRAAIDWAAGEGHIKLVRDP